MIHSSTSHNCAKWIVLRNAFCAVMEALSFARSATPPCNVGDTPSLTPRVTGSYPRSSRLLPLGVAKPLPLRVAGTASTANNLSPWLLAVWNRFAAPKPSLAEIHISAKPPQSIKYRTLLPEIHVISPRLQANRRHSRHKADMTNRTHETILSSLQAAPMPLLPPNGQK